MQQVQDQPFDTVIVGGGAVGVCAAYYLHRAGQRVAVVDQGAIGGACSAGNAGMIVPSHIVPLAAPGVIRKGLRWLFSRSSPLYIKPRLDADLLRWLWQFRGFCTEAHVTRSIPVLRDLSLASVALFEEMKESGLDFAFHQDGLLMVFETAKGEQENVEMARLAEDAGLDVTVLDADALRACEPNLRPPARGAVLYHQDAHLDPAAFVDTLHTHLEEEGVVFLPDTTAEGFTRENGHIRAIQTANGLIRGEAFVLAAGAWTPALAAPLGVRVPVLPGKGYSVRCPAPADAPRLPIIFTEAKTTLTPMGDDLRFAGTLELTDLAPTIDPLRVRPIQAMARRYAPEAPTAAVENVWHGFRPCSPDGLPLIGPALGFENLLLATGHGMMGITLAPITGQLIAAQLTAETPLVNRDPFSAQRFS